MTRKEVTEIFSVLMLAYPRAEMFKGGIQKLGPTISLWATCLDDVDFWTGQQAVIRVCKECVFPPSIAEFRTAAQDVTKELEQGADAVFSHIRSYTGLYGSTQEMYEKLPADSKTKAVIDAMGGPQNLFEEHEFNGQTTQIWRIDTIRKTYKVLARQSNQLTSKGHALLSEKGKTDG